MTEPETAGTEARPSERASVLRTVSVDRELGVPPGRQLERRLAVMVREGRLEPGRRLPSTRRLAPAVGLHRNTVAAAYRRLAGRGLVELRHGARARVWPESRFGRDGGRSGGADLVLAAATDVGTARLMATEVRDVLPAGIDVEPVVVDEATRFGPGDAAAAGLLVAALPGAALRRVVDGSELESPGRVVRVVQDPRERVRNALLAAPPLSVVAVATGCTLLREAVGSDAGRLRGREFCLRAPASRSPRRAIEGDGLPPAADLVIADRLAADAFCGESPSPSGPDVVRARLLSPESLAAISGGVAGTGADTARDRDP